MERVKFKTDKLRGRMIERFGSIKDCARELGFSTHTISDKMNGNSDFKTSEIVCISLALGIKSKDVAEYFLEEAK